MVACPKEEPLASTPGQHLPLPCIHIESQKHRASPCSAQAPALASNNLQETDTSLSTTSHKKLDTEFPLSPSRFSGKLIL
ncbi:hypothetical protein M758_5G128400 [Ceratodon purpureus]|nr:hypothetical protein M758_5G128400 [Ceratodon purpureus]